jgi:ABC-type transport system involved in multi-copper enzyme maturation permease subunit
MPVDRVRWASILAGLFTVLAALVFFTVLGIALGLSTFDADNPRSFGIGVGIYGIISALVAFALGGFLAARTAAVSGRGNALLQSGLVWIVTIALIVNFIGSGVGTLLNIAGGAASTAIEAASNVAGDAAGVVAENPQLQATVAQGATAEAPSIQATVAAVPAQVQEQLGNVSSEDVEEAARNASSAAWWTLLGLGVSALAALLGGLAGARRRDVIRTRATS